MSPKNFVLEKVSEPPAEEIRDAVRNLKEWISKEPHLPDVDDEEWLTTFFYNNKFSLEKTKEKIDNYYSLKNKYPHLLKDRDPTRPEFRRFAPTSSLSITFTRDGARLLLLQFDSDPNLFVVADYLKRATMVFDMMMLEKDRLTSYIFIWNCKNMHYKHFLKMGTEMKAASDIFSKAYTERLEAIHIVNAPPYSDMMLKTFVPFFPKKYAQRIFVHTVADSNLLEMVDNETLWCDLGGKGPSTAETGEWCQRKLEEYKDWYAEQDKLCSNELLRQKGGDQVEELRGSFRKIEVD